jgi:acetoin utilization deacetylase AcuC-like enzyme
VLKIAFDKIYAHPLPEGHRFPMLKYELIPGQLLHEGVIENKNLFSPDKVEEDVILLTHSRQYWERLRDLKLSNQEERRTGFPLSSQLIEREMRIVQGTIDGCFFAMQHGVAFNIAGGTHHSGKDWGEGFCLLNDQAIAANYLLENGYAKSILIIDLDVHQGNGTANIFNDHPSVFTLSIHAEKNFPFRKEASDLDIGLENGVGDSEYLSILDQTLPRLFEQLKPDFVFYLSGVDVLATDKLGYLKLSRQGCKERDKKVFELCKKYAVPVQVSMGGGYSHKIGDIVEAHCNTFRVAMDFYF